MDILLGMQWGDEGKGKVVDVLAPKYDVVARFQGGPNAGHTLEFDGKKFVLHQIPSGVFQEGTSNIIGNGVVLDIRIFREEIEKLEAAGFSDIKSKILLSKKTHLIIPTHRLLDAAYEKSKGDQKIGSTLKGIGPTYQDKSARVGLRTGDLFAEDFSAKYDALKAKHIEILKFYDFDYTEQLPDMEKEFFSAVDFLKTMSFVNSEYFVNDALKAGKKVLAEGAQGTLLDVDFGSYPFVTSSNTFAAGASTGLGVAPNSQKNIYGIFKAYCTRVGSGPFPTELFDKTGEELQNLGHEFGATTGRRRRCGWLDLPILKYAVMINGATELFMMKADVMNTFEEIKICTEYLLKDGTKTKEVPYDLEDIKEPIYTTLKGWNQEVDPKLSFEELPQELMEYIKFIEDYIEVPITMVSLGPDREETIMK
ncbi:adenylosuccinate synthase [Flammeovirga sp. EKP202]|uniref:adenylosuccinate synthase n=1 Tax=Flammeovirga sp. EKP202 TaxID=2770592 RepID=UPI00165F62F5|nr:adenylosuccinate synthase [Flammeovirga sp. EKP202]MBD0403460.1 adenylosuccinate synthase [Flammeovirga sp. EKP202]